MRFFLLASLALALTASAESSRRQTTVSIEGQSFLINGRPTYAGRQFNGMKIEGLLMNSRMVQGIFDDLNPETRPKWNYPDGPWDAERNTREFVAAMSSWRERGLLSFTINLQGGSPEGYSKSQPWHNSAFESDGGLRPAYMARLKQILDRADELGMVPILGLFYFGQDERLTDEVAIVRAVDNAVNWVLERGYRNVLIVVNNECNVRYDHAILRPDRVHELIERVKARQRDSRRLLASTSYGGGAVPRENVVRTADFLLMHGNGVREPARIRKMVDDCRAMPAYSGQPILFNEDDHFDFDKPDNNMLAAISRYASWGYFDFRMKGEGFDDGYQSVPVNWGIRSPRKRGFFDLLAKVTGAAPARLKVSDNGRFLVHEDGRSFFWLADTAWALFFRLTREEAVRYLDDRKSKRFNVIQAVILGGGASESNAYGQRALLPKDAAKPHNTKTNPFDPAKPNEAYFKHVDWVLDRAAERGFHVAMLPTWGANVISTNRIFNADNARRYGEFLGRRYREKPVVWALGGDENAPGFEPVWRAMAAGLAEGRGGQHLMTYHPRGGASSGQWFHNEPWLAFNMIQSGHTRFRPAATDRLLLVSRDYARQPAKPVLDAESVYEDIPEGLTKGGKRGPFDTVPDGERITARDVRAAAYGTVFAGAMGYTYGGNGVFQMTKTNLQASWRWDPRQTWDKALQLPGASQMQHLRALIESFPMLLCVPVPDLIEPDSNKPVHTAYDRPVAMRGLAGNCAMIYIANGRNIRVRLDRLATTTMTASWFNPRNGRWHAGNTESNEPLPFTRGIATGPSAPLSEFSPPSSLHNGNDWVLVLRAE